jgi:predicted ATP-dependent endonuclease of OLD family
LSSGEKQVIYRLGYILKDIDVVKGGIILIDEPEISLHPAWQIKFREILLDMFENVDVQIIIATHSPYILTNIDPTKEECILVDRTKKSTEQLKIRGASPSMNLVNYIAFGIPSKELHIELYDRMIQA